MHHIFEGYHNHLLPLKLFTEMNGMLMVVREFIGEMEISLKIITLSSLEHRCVHSVCFLIY
jgi:hypothetical protein